MNTCVVGLGKIGLPLAVQIAGRGHRVVGADLNPEVVDLVNAGREPFPGEAELADRLLRSSPPDCSRPRRTRRRPCPFPGPSSSSSRWWSATTSTRISPRSTRRRRQWPRPCVRGRWSRMRPPCPSTRPGDASHRCWPPDRACGSARTCSSVTVPSGCSVVASSPTCVATRSSWAASSPPGPHGPWSSTDRSWSSTPGTTSTVPTGCGTSGAPRGPELAKLAETTYRNVNIAFANELAMAADLVGVDVRAVIEASNSQPFSHIHQPGIAVGGHCIPVYPHFLLQGCPEAHLVRAALDVNAGMPDYAVGLLGDLLGTLRGAKVVVLGAAYRGGVKETAFSGVYPVAAALRSADPRSPSTIPSTTTVSSLRSGSSRSTWVRRSTVRSCRLTTPGTDNWRPEICPASGPSSTAEVSWTRRRGRGSSSAGSVTVGDRRIVGRDGTREPSVATTRARVRKRVGRAPGRRCERAVHGTDGTFRLTTPVGSGAGMSRSRGPSRPLPSLVEVVARWRCRARVPPLGPGASTHHRVLPGVTRRGLSKYTSARRRGGMTIGTSHTREHRGTNPCSRRISGGPNTLVIRAVSPIRSRGLDSGSVSNTGSRPTRSPMIRPIRRRSRTSGPATLISWLFPIPRT